jgi:hypothetical protein
MLASTLTSAIAKTPPAEHVLPMPMAGPTYQGLDTMLAVAMLGIYFRRLLAPSLPADASRPSMFIAVGPPSSLTALAFIGRAQDFSWTNIPSSYSMPGIANQALTPDVLQLLALPAAAFPRASAVWVSGIALIPAIDTGGRNAFRLNGYAYMSPNVGFAIATVKI